MRVIKSLFLTTTLLVSALDAATGISPNTIATAEDPAISQRSERVTHDFANDSREEQDNLNVDREEKIDFDQWFSDNLQCLKTDLITYSSHNTIRSTTESRNLARSYVNRVSGWNSLKHTAGACAIMWGWTLYSYYSQYTGELELFWKSKGSRNSVETGYPEVFPPFVAITAGLTVGTFNFALNYYNLGWLTAEKYIASSKPYITLLGAFILSCCMYSFDNHHYILPTPYAIFGGLCLSLLYDYYKQSTITTLPNPLKSIALINQEALTKTIDLIATLIENKQMRNKSTREDIFPEITKYLFRTN